MRQGGKFVFEHPATASSWEKMELKKLREEAGVFTVELDMCRFGLTSQDSQGTGLVRKTTRLLTNIACLKDMAGLRCCGGHRHVELVSGRAGPAAVYTDMFCKAILGAWDLERKGLAQALELANVGIEQQDDLCEPEPAVEGVYWDDLKSQPLDPTLAKRARMEEIEVFKQRGVYDLIPRSQLPAGKRIIGTRWVETDKGIGAEVKVRSRLVAQEFARGKTPDEFYAPTPPLLAMRWLLSEAASQGLRGPHLGAEAVRCMVLDVKRAFLYGEVQRELYIEVPVEDERSCNGQMIGRLRKSMYGTQDAPAVWSRETKKMLMKRGFQASRIMPCLFHNAATGVCLIAHVDDLLLVGAQRELKSLKMDLQKEYEVDGHVLGEGEGCIAETRFLGRRLRFTPTGLEWESDPKIVEAILKEADLEEGSGVLTPGVKAGEMECNEPMGSAEASKYRRTAAQLNYLSQDRADLGYASKEISRSMANPCKGDELKTKRVARYIQRFPRCVVKYPWQEPTSELSLFSDSDWGGCVRTRKSTTGGVLMRGTHLIAHWSRTQQLISLSSAEAELNASI